MLKEAILHFGPPKTGTTVIQGALSSVAPKLTAYGIFYPTMPSSNEGQPALAWELLESIGRPVARLSKDRTTWSDVLEQARCSGAQTLLISSEDLTLLSDRAALEFLKATLQDLEISVVFGLREPRALALSIWQQSVKWGIGIGEELLEVDDAISLILEKRLVCAPPYLELIEAVLNCRVRLFTVPAAINIPMLLERFAQATNLPDEIRPAFLSAGHSSQTNKSLSYRQIQTCLSLNRLLRLKFPLSANYPSNACEKNLLMRRAILSCLPSEEKTQIPLKEITNCRLMKARDDLVNFVSGREGIYGTVDDLTTCHEASLDYLPRSNDAQTLHSLLLDALAQQSGQLLDQHAYLREVEKARDFWKATADSWHRAALKQKM